MINIDERWKRYIEKLIIKNIFFYLDKVTIKTICSSISKIFEHIIGKIGKHLWKIIKNKSVIKKVV